MTPHRYISQTCERCGALAAVVAKYQRPPSDDDPYGSLDLEALCASCGRRALDEEHPPRLVEHDEALKRQQKERANNVIAQRRVWHEMQVRLGDW